MKGYTKITSSESVFDIVDVASIGSQPITLDELSKKSDQDRVTVNINVTKVEEPQLISGNKQKQDITIADPTNIATLTLWEENINKLTEGSSYQLTRLIVRTFRGKNYLSMPNTGSTVTSIDDVEVPDETALDIEEDQDAFIEQATIAGVQQLQQIFNCICCKKGTVEATSTPDIGQCQNCNTTQLLHKTKQKFPAKLFLSLSNETKCLRAYEDILQQVVGADSPITCENILGAPAFDLKFNTYHVITEISRP